MLEPGKSYSGIAALGGELWLIGGYFREGDRTKATSTVEIFDPRSRRYRLGPPLEQPRGQVVALTVRDRLFAIGGAGDEQASNEMISIAAGETHWKREPPAPGPIVQASGCVVGGRIYIASGPGSKCPGLFVYDTQQRTWSQVKHPSDSAPNAPLCAAHNGQVWVMGGVGGSGGRVATHFYSPHTRQWQKGPDLPLPVSWGAAVEVNGRLLIAGGAYRETRAKDYFNSDRAFLLRRP
jgi:N-acetylneuraminic acid mutarotase